MITAQGDFAGRVEGFEAVDDCPMAFDDWGFGFQEEKVGLEVEHGLLEVFGRPSFCDAVGPADLMAIPGGEGGGPGGDDGVDVGGFVEPLELAVLRKKGDALGGRQGGITDHHAHRASFRVVGCSEG